MGKPNGKSVNVDSFKYDPKMPPVPSVFFPAGIDACALYREFIPHINTPESIFLFRTGPIDLKEILHCKIAIVQRSGSEDNFKAISGLKRVGMKIIYDLDDNIWSLPPYNPMAKAFKELQHGFARCASIADLMTVSTIGLRTAARTGFSSSKPIEVIPNAIDFNLFHKKDIKRQDDKVIVGWGGSTTHSEDVREAFSVITDVLDKNPNAIMEIVGASAIETNKKIVRNERGMQEWAVESGPSKIALHPQSRFRRWVPVSEYPNRLASWGWDIALAPLLDNRFNRSKSNIKMLEAAALMIPCLVSEVQPYTEFCALGDDDVKWLVCRKAKDWKDKLNILINEPDRRDAIGRKMYDIAYRFFNAKNIGHHYQYAFQKALSL